MTGRSIFRVSRTVDNPWVQVHRDTARSASLSWQARGMLLFILSHPDDWTITNKYLERASPAGRQATEKIIAELKRAGYMHREQVRTESGRIEWQTTVYELPVLRVEPSTGSPSTENPYMAPSTALPSTVNPYLYEQRTNEQKREDGVGTPTPPDLTPSDTAPTNALVVSGPPSAPVPAPGFSDALAAALMDATGWTERLRNGAYPAWLGRCLGILGSASGDDVDAARAILASVVAHERWQYRPMARADQFPRFLASMVKELSAADPAVTATGAMLARRCGIDLAIAGAKERRAFEDIARAGLATGRTARELDAVIADARRESRFAACGIPAWRLRQGLAALPVAVAR